MASSSTIVAAGAVVTRLVGDEKQFLLVHRHFRDDWSFPKGKVDPGEHLLATAIREVREETGFAIRLGLPLPTQRYQANGMPKEVFYWHAELLEGDFVANEEVDEIRWVDFATAATTLTYSHDVDVLHAAAVAPSTNPFIVLRHTQAMKRAEWQATSTGQRSPDAARPLTAVGRMQATTLIPAIAAFGIASVHSSDSRRCRDTVSPYASARSLAITLEPFLSEESHQADATTSLARVQEIALDPKSSILCTHRPVMPTVMKAIDEAYELLDNPDVSLNPALTPGSLVVFHRDASDLRRILSVERHIR